MTPIFNGPDFASLGPLPELHPIRRSIAARTTRGVLAAAFTALLLQPVGLVDDAHRQYRGSAEVVLDRCRLPRREVHDIAALEVGIRVDRVRPQVGDRGEVLP